MKVVIIGSGPAGVSAAETICAEDRNCEVVMLSAEPYPPYSPPALVEYFLSGKPVHFWKGEDFADRLNIDYHSGKKAAGIKTADRQVTLDYGERISYDRLIIAAGARLYSPLEGADLDNIHNFKSLQAGEKMLSKVRSGEVNSALIVGAGFIGVEIALLLKEMGLGVTMLVRSRVMRTTLDPETSEVVLNVLKQKGIDVIQGEDADAVAFSGKKQAEAVQMRSGRELRADLLVAATGLKPNLELLQGSDLESNWGILVDSHLKTNYPYIYAAGDIVETTDRISGKLYTNANYPNAVEQGRVAALNAIGHEAAYSGSDSMNSLKHIGIPVMAAGIMEGEELRRRVDGRLLKLWVLDNRLVGFRLTGETDNAGLYLNLMRRKVDVSFFKDELLDAGFGYSRLVARSVSPELI